MSILKLFDMWAPVGSFHMNDPNWKDKDFIVFIEGFYIPNEALEWCDKSYYNDYKNCRFKSLKKDKINVIILPTEIEFINFLFAFEKCKREGIFNKIERVKIHETLRSVPVALCDIEVNKSSKQAFIK